MSQTETTTIAVSRRNRQRLEDAKPYESLSNDEFLGELLDVYGADD